MILVIGASGFIGRHLLSQPGLLDTQSIRCLTRDPASLNHLPPHIEVVRGDLRDDVGVARWLEPQATVINLAFDRHARPEENLAGAQALARACTRARVRRLVHLSTASVVGRNRADLLDEHSECDPETAYESTKLLVDDTLRREMPQTELVILRPTAVFGPGGQNLVKLARETAQGNAVIRYLRSCLHGRRRMNLVSVQTVAASLAYLVNWPAARNYEVFIVSDDEAPTNNYYDVERTLIGAFGRRDYPWPVLPVPRMLENRIRRVAGRSIANPKRRFLCDKLVNAGFIKPITFDAALQQYALYLSSQFRSDAVVMG